MKSRFAVSVGLAAALAAAVLFVTPVEAATTTVTANFATPVDYPLVKSKFGLFNSCLVPLTRLQRDIGLADSLHADTYRFDGGLGGGPYPGTNSSPGCRYTTQPVQGTASSLSYDFSEFDQLATVLRSHNIDPYWSYEYTPVPLQPAGGDYRSAPASLPAFTNVTQAFASHFKAKGDEVRYGEIGNEPDLSNLFWTGSQSDYFNMFHAGSAGLRAGDPDVKVGGPAAFGTDLQNNFLNYVSAQRASGNEPLDFLSFHRYETDPIPRATIMNNSLASAGNGFAQTELHYNEFNYVDPTGSSGTDNPVDHYAGAPNLLNEFSALIQHPEVTEVNWAQFEDADCTGCGRLGLVTTEGHVTPTYNAWKAYSMMPVDRRSLTIAGTTDIAGLASTDQHHSSMLMWNNSSTTANAPSVKLQNVPFPVGTVKVYRIDSTHASYYDLNTTEALVPTETHTNVNTANWTWPGSLPSRGIVLIDVQDGTGTSALQNNSASHYVTTHRYYPDRFSTAYSDFDRHTWIARQGMAGNTFADQEIGVVADQLPQTLNFTAAIDGTLTANDANSCACLRVDYHTAAGYSKGVIFHGPYKGGTDLYNGSRSAPVPFGTKAPANQVVTVADLSSFSIQPAQYAPTGWDGRVTLTYLLQNAGSQARWRVQAFAG